MRFLQEKEKENVLNELNKSLLWNRDICEGWWILMFLSIGFGENSISGIGFGFFAWMWWFWLRNDSVMIIWFAIRTGRTWAVGFFFFFNRFCVSCSNIHSEFELFPAFSPDWRSLKKSKWIFDTFFVIYQLTVGSFSICLFSHMNSTTAKRQEKIIPPVKTINTPPRFGKPNWAEFSLPFP